MGECEEGNSLPRPYFLQELHHPSLRLPLPWGGGSSSIQGRSLGDMDTQILETATLLRKGTAYSHMETKPKKKMDGLLKSTDCRFPA